MKILSFKKYLIICESLNISLKKYKKLNFKLNEIVRRKSDNILGRIHIIGINKKNKSDDFSIHWSNSSNIDDILKNNILFLPDLLDKRYKQEDIKKLEPEEQNLLNNVKKFNL